MLSRHLVLSFILFVAGASLSFANSFGPPLAHTGAPAIGSIPTEPTCNTSGCHTGNPLNQNGTLEILGVPPSYVAGQRYTLTVRLTSTATLGSSTRKWGFELTAVSMTDGQGAGSFDSPDLAIGTGTPIEGNRPYISHDTDTNYPGASSPVEWSFSWTAPATQVGTVGFFAAGNAANGDVTNLGDHIYTASASVPGTSTPVEPVTWGRLKSPHFFASGS